MATLITFPPSLDCELSRFLLAHYRFPYEERRHVVIFSFFVTLWHGSTLYFPLLYGGSFPPLDHVRKMIDYFDPLCPADRNLTAHGARPRQRGGGLEGVQRNIGDGGGGVCLLPSPAAPRDHDPAPDARNAGL